MVENVPSPGHRKKTGDPETLGHIWILRVLGLHKPINTRERLSQIDIEDLASRRSFGVFIYGLGSHGIHHHVQLIWKNIFGTCSRHPGQANPRSIDQIYHQMFGLRRTRVSPFRFLLTPAEEKHRYLISSDKKPGCYRRLCFIIHPFLILYIYIFLECNTKVFQMKGN